MSVWRIAAAASIGFELLSIVACSANEKKPPEKSVTASKPLNTRKQGVDWPRFLGPTGDSKSSEIGLQVPWPKEGPRVVWQKPLGTGYGIGTISQGRLYQYDRTNDKSQLICMNAETGDELWTFSHPTNYIDLYGYNGGPRSSPTVDEDRVYIYGVEGMLHCLDALSGELIWKVDTVEQFGVIQNFFGVGSTPVVEGDLLIVMVGGSDDDAKRVPPGQ